MQRMNRLVSPVLSLIYIFFLFVFLLFFFSFFLSPSPFTRIRIHQALAAIRSGATRITHLFNAMSQWESRSLGIVGAAFTSNAYASIICDGLHCDFLSVALAKKLKGDKLMLITDAVTQDTTGRLRVIAVSRSL
jgi:N-acetylglucosamine-6-phosphate deacetylase